MDAANLSIMQARKGNMCVRKNYIKDGDYPLVITKMGKL